MIIRFKENPILVPSDIEPSQKEMVVECLLNPGAFTFKDKIWLLLRVAERPKQKNDRISFPILDAKGKTKIMEVPLGSQDLDISDPRVIKYKGDNYLTTMSHFRLISSDDGIHFSEDKNYPGIFPFGEYENYGIEDCRVTFIENTYYLTYTAVSNHGVGVGLMITKDWINFERKGLILPPHNKDCTIFNEKINGRFYMLHRPSSPELGGNYIWLAQSEDLISWSNHKCIAHSRKEMWDSARIGAGCAPVKTAKGWLAIYHGADYNHSYCLGALLLDLNNPWKVLARSEKPIMFPEKEYEKKGFFGNVIFTNGHIINGDKIMMYYGASDEVVCFAELSISKILDTFRY